MAFGFDFVEVVVLVEDLSAFAGAGGSTLRRGFGGSGVKAGYLVCDDRSGLEAT
jgi:hypothetical protein